MRNFKTDSFHEHTVLALSQDQGIINLVLENTSSLDVTEQSTIKFYNIENLTIDGKDSELIPNNSLDGEILSIDEKDGTILLLVEWKNFSTRNFFTTSYKFTCERFDITSDR